MVPAVTKSPAQETHQALELGELSQKISFTAIELGKVAEVVGNRLAGFDDLIRNSRINCLRKIDEIHDAWYSSNLTDRKKYQEDLMNVLTDAASITSTKVLQELGHLVLGLRDVATRAHAGSVFDQAEADIRELSLECLTFIGSLRSKTQASQDIISFDKQRSEYSEVTKTHKALHDKLFDLSVSFQRCVQELAGSIGIFALQDASHEQEATLSMKSAEDSCPRARQIIRDVTREISSMKFPDGAKLTAAGRDSMRTALGYLDYVVEMFYNQTLSSRPATYDFSGLTRTTSQIQTALALTSGATEHLLAGLQSSKRTTVEHSLEQIQRLGAQLDSLLGSGAGSTQELPSTETLRLLTMRAGLIEHLQAAIKRECQWQNSLPTLSRFGLVGLDGIKEILLSEQSSDALQNACLDELTCVLRYQSSPSALPESYDRWFGELLATMQNVPRTTENSAALSKLQELYSTVKLAPA
jgi:hypothetical protein